MAAAAPVSVSDEVAPPPPVGAIRVESAISSSSVASNTEAWRRESRSKSGKTTFPSTGDPTLLPGSREVDPEVPDVVETRESERSRRGETI